MYVPWVASDACCKNTVSPAILQMSIGIPRRWDAKMQFMRGMYWAARSPLTERIRIRDCRLGGREGSRPSLPPGLAGPTLEGPVEVEESMVLLFM